MVKVWGGRAIRWALLVLVAVILVAFFGRLFLTLDHRVKVAEAQVRQDKIALAVSEGKIAERDLLLANQHLTVTVPAPQVTVTMAPGASASSATTGSKVVTVPSPFAVPGPTVTAKLPSPAPAPTPIVTVTNCPVVHLLFLCL